MGLQYGFGVTYTSILTKRRGRAVVLAVWMYAMVWGITSNIHWTNSEAPIVITNTLECVSRNKYHVTAVFIVVFYIPILIMGFLYRKIFLIAHRHAVEIKTLHKRIIRQYSTETDRPARRLALANICDCFHQRRGSLLSRMENEISTDADQENVSFAAGSKSTVTISINTPLHHENRMVKLNTVTKATTTIAGVCGCFLICWLPVSILAVGLAWSNETFQTVHASVHMIVVDILPVFNSTVNPFIYFMVNSVYRKALQRALNRWKNIWHSYYSNLRFR